MYIEREGRVFLPVKQETYADLWQAINGEPLGNDGFKDMTIGGVTVVVDSAHFREWAAKSK